jgi:hypothetical protein
VGHGSVELARWVRDGSVAGTSTVAAVVPGRWSTVMAAFLAVVVGAVLVACAPYARQDAARRTPGGPAADRWLWLLTTVGGALGVVGSEVLHRAVGWWALVLWIGVLLFAQVVVAMYRWSESAAR